MPNPADVSFPNGAPPLQLHVAVHVRVLPPSARLTPVTQVGISQLTLWPLACGDGEVSLELGSEAACRRVRLEGGGNRGLPGLLTSLLGSFCREEETTTIAPLSGERKKMTGNKRWEEKEKRTLRHLRGDSPSQSLRIKTFAPVCYIRVSACIHNREFTEFKTGTRAGVTVQQATVLTGDFEPNATVVVVVTGR
ncbi:hypothetical protein EYF80_047932 [Liparis tanakae]|uniref:Uncharacterized protein n=1 Tax=Liparis tanakae TaxID=230148 RepID=A0A4Z2FL74_9TELE|nr:hypothetical protein EYF80_047932 [Liparis tanakae]